MTGVFLFHFFLVVCTCTLRVPPFFFFSNEPRTAFPHTRRPLSLSSDLAAGCLHRPDAPLSVNPTHTHTHACNVRSNTCTRAHYWSGLALADGIRDHHLSLLSCHLVPPGPRPLSPCWSLPHVVAVPSPSDRKHTLCHQPFPPVFLSVNALFRVVMACTLLRQNQFETRVQRTNPNKSGTRHATHISGGTKFTSASLNRHGYKMFRYSLLQHSSCSTRDATAVDFIHFKYFLKQQFVCYFQLILIFWP